MKFRRELLDEPRERLLVLIPEVFEVDIDTGEPVRCHQIHASSNMPGELLVRSENLVDNFGVL